MKNPKYYIPAFALFAIGFFTRYTFIIMLPAIALCFLYYNSFKIKKSDLKYILIGLALAIIISAVFLNTISSMGDGYLGFDIQLQGGISGQTGSTSDNAYNPDILYYLINIPNFISSSDTTFVGKNPSLNTPTVLSLLIFLILIAGTILWVKRTKFEFDSKKIAGLALCFIALVTFHHFSSVITITIMFLGLYLLGKDSENRMGLFMLSWFLVYFIYMSYISIKVNRYIIPALPALTYFIMVAVSEINEKLSRKEVLPIILIALFLIQGFTFVLTFEDTSEFRAPEEMSDYIKANIDNWSQIKIGNYNIRPYYWYLGMNSPGIERGNTQKIIESDVSYYISNVKQKNLTNFTEIKEIDGLYLYKRTS
jgi:4-amino-4-deoxy-L-arabinose transferase-like glycosyltransferase